MTENKESTGFNPFNATIDITRTVQQTMRLSKTPITLNEVMSHLPSVIYGVKHPLTENVKQVNCGTKVTVTCYIPDGMAVHDIVEFEALVRAAVGAYVSGLADAWRAKKNGPPPQQDEQRYWEVRTNAIGYSGRIPIPSLPSTPNA